MFIRRSICRYFWIACIGASDWSRRFFGIVKIVVNLKIIDGHFWDTGKTWRCRIFMSILFFEIGSYAFRFGVGRLEVNDELSLVLVGRVDVCGGLVGVFDWVVALIDDWLVLFFFLDAFDSFTVAAESFFFFFDFDFGGAASILMKMLIKHTVVIGLRLVEMGRSEKVVWVLGLSWSFPKYRYIHTHVCIYKIRV